MISTATTITGTFYAMLAQGDCPVANAASLLDGSALPSFITYNQNTYTLTITVTGSS